MKDSKMGRLIADHKEQSKEERELMSALRHVRDVKAEISQEVIEQLFRDGALECFNVNWRRVYQRYAD